MVKRRAACHIGIGCDLIDGELRRSRMEEALAKDSAGAFRTKVRVKSAAEQADAASSKPTSTAPPRSLMEALKQATPGPTNAELPVGKATTQPAASKAPAPTETQPSSVSRQARELIDSEPPRPSRSSRSGKVRVGRLAAARLRQLQRLKEAAAGLESLARGQIEEATVEIIRRDGNGPSGRGRMSGLPSKR